MPASTHTLATPANMRLVTAANLTRRAVAYSPTTGETCSATAGDYFNQPDDEPLRDSAGEPMILVFPFSGYTDALSGDVVR